MARTHAAGLKLEKTASQRAWGMAALWGANGWWAFCVLVFAIKLSLFWLDPTAKLFMGDSGSYISTALTGWIPPDRSYFYGYLIRWLAVWPHSFTPLLLTQVLASGLTAVVFAIICSRFLEISNRFSFLFGLLCALDPCQLVWERYVMTETFSLLVYVLVLYWSLAYLRDRLIWQLAVVQGLSVVLIGFRMSYLLVVQVCTIVLPIIAFACSSFPLFRNRSKTGKSLRGVAGIGLGHLVVSVALMFVLHDAYKQVNGRLSHRKPAYLYDAGAHLVAVWAPALKPSDATDPRFGDLIANGHQFKIDNLRLRDAQQYGKDFLIHRWTKIEANARTRDRVARQTAINALRHHPLDIVDITLKTYAQYWGVESMRKQALRDLGYGELTDDQIKMLAEKFRFVTVNRLPVQPFSFSQNYFLGAWPYYFIIIVSPLTCAIATWIARHRAFAFLFFVHSSILMLVVTALSPRACVRYLQPVSILTLLSIAILVNKVAKRATSAPLQAA